MEVDFWQHLGTMRNTGLVSQNFRTDKFVILGSAFLALEF